MRIVMSAALFLSFFANQGLASDSAKVSFALNGLSIGREKAVTKPATGESATTATTAVDLFGTDGQSALPAIEIGLSIGDIVAYAYPNSAAGGRELWLGLKAGDSLEMGVIAGTNHLVFSPADNRKVKTEYTDRVGLFVNHRRNFNEDITVDFSIAAFYSNVSTAYTDTNLSQNAGEFGLSAEALWIWEPAENIEVNSGIGFGWSQSKQKLGGKDLQTIDWSRIGLKLAQTRIHL
jgi:hypothetical protein